MERSNIARTSGWIWFAAALLVLFEGFRQAIFLVPTESTMGNIQRIFYWHLPSAILSLVFPYINLVASVAYLYFRHRNPLRALTADALAVASAEVAVLYATVVLLTGMLWARPVWGIWWTWDARLTTYFILWLLYVSYLMVRQFSSTGQTGTLAAVLSIFAAVDVPITFMSIRWWRTQHPAPVFGGGKDSGLDASFYPAVWWNLAGWAMWGLFILLFRFALERRRQIAEQELALQSIEASMETPQ